MSETDSEFDSFLAQHPRLIGATFAALAVLSQLGTVAADGTGHIGP